MSRDPSEASRPPQWSCRWPLELDGRGELRRASVERPERGIEVILGTRPGDRPLRPGFGWLARGRIDDLSGGASRAVAAVHAEEALRRWAPDLEVERVEVEPPEGGAVSLTVHARAGVWRVRVPWFRDEAPGEGALR